MKSPGHFELIVPPQVQAAQAFCYFFESIRNQQDREIRDNEKAAYRSAIELLEKYFSSGLVEEFQPPRPDFCDCCGAA